jgi:hypothetical protein
VQYCLVEKMLLRANDKDREVSGKAQLESLQNRE